MTGYQWGTNQFGNHIFGKITDNELINCNGVKIIDDDRVYIAYFDHRGWETTPYLYCSARMFKIYE